MKEPGTKTLKAKAAWLQMGDPGVLDQKNQLLLHFPEDWSGPGRGLEKKPRSRQLQEGERMV